MTLPPGKGVRRRGASSQRLKLESCGARQGKGRWPQGTALVLHPSGGLERNLQTPPGVPAWSGCLRVALGTAF